MIHKLLFKHSFAALLFTVLACLSGLNGWAQFSIAAGGTNYTQDFSSLGTTAGTWTDNTTLTGWYARTDATASITTIGVNTGATTAAGLYSFGVLGTNALADRALGYAPSNGYTGASGVGKGYVGWRLKNNTGSAITSITIIWTGEQYRKENNAAAHTLNLFYQTGVTVTSLVTGTWTPASSTFTSPVFGATAAAVLDGNAPANRVANITVNLTVSIAAGDEIMLRWDDLNDAGNDHQMAIDDVSVNATISSGLLTPPVLTPDGTNNNVDNNIDITFTDDPSWRANINAVKIGGTALTLTTDYFITAGNIQLKPSGGNLLLTTTGTKNITVEAIGYTNAPVTQVILAGVPTANSTATINSALAQNITRTITCTAKDQYNNLVSGYTFMYDVTITNNDVTTAEIYTIDGVALTATTNNVSVLALTNASGVATFPATLPAIIDGADGISIQVQLNNGTTNVGTPFSFIQSLMPTITVGTVTSFGNQYINSSSAEKTYIVSGSNLTADIIITPPVGFEISATTGSGFIANPNTISLTPTSGTVNATIFVRFSPTLIQLYSGNITHTSTGATQQDLAVTGTGIAAPPGLPFSENFNYTLSSLLTNNGWVSHSGGGTAPITVTAASILYPGYLSSGIGNEVTMATSGEDDNTVFASQNAGSLYASFIVNVTTAQTTGDYMAHFAATSGAAASTFAGRIWIKKDASSANFAFGVSKSSTAANISYTGFNYVPGTTYLLVVKYTFVAGVTNDIGALFIDPALHSAEPTPTIITLPADNGTADPAQLTSFCLRQGSSTAAPTLKLDGIRIATTWEDIVGILSAPTIQADTLTFSLLATTGFTANWTNGNGSSRAVFVKQGNTGNAAPADGITYTANPIFGSIGSEIGSTGWYCVYNGTGTSAAITGLTASTDYTVHVCEYNGGSGSEKYNSGTNVTNPLVQATPSGAVAPVVTSPTATAITAISATLGGNITSDGGSAITERGTLWSTSSPVTISDNKLAEGTAATGVFTHPRTTLTSNTLIHYAAYATNSIGTTLSAEGSFTTLYGEPTNHATAFTATAPNSSNITVTWNDNDGTQPALGFLILGNKTGTFADPVDGTDPADDAVLADGSGVVHVAHGVQNYTWTTLDASTQYYFKIYPYTNSGTSIDYKTDNTPVTVPTANATTLSPTITPYTWQGADNGLWTEAANWTPSRTTPATNDILQFSDGTTKTVTAVPTQTIGQLVLSNNTVVNLQSAGIAILTVAGSTGTDLAIPAGCALNLNAINAITINLPAGSTGSIGGTMSFSATAATAHRLTAVDLGAITFTSGAIFTAGLNFSGNPFGTANLNSIFFASGSTYLAVAGSNPFGASQPNSVVVFQTGSLYKAVGTATASITPAFSGRTYANVEIDQVLAVTSSGTAAGILDNLTITNGTFNFNMTATPGHSIKGNIYVAPGATLTFSPASPGGTVNLNGSALQTISGGGTITAGTLSTLNINNAAGVNLGSDMSINGTLSLTNGLFSLGNSNLLLGATAVIGGTPSAANMIVASGNGELRKSFTTTNSFTYPVGDNTGTAEYSPVTLSFTSGTFTAAYAGVKLANIPFSGSVASYLKRNWTVTSSGINAFSCNAQFNYVPADVVGAESDLYCVRVLPLPVSVYNAANTTLHHLTATGISSFGTFTGESASPSKTLDLVVFLEGLKIAGDVSMNQAQGSSGAQFAPGIADQVTIELHESTAPYNVAYTFANVDLNTDGTLSVPTVPSEASGSYYIVVKHRNSIEVWSAIPVPFTGTLIFYDFSIAASQAYGNALKSLGNNIFGMYAGDVNQDGQVDAADLVAVDNDAANFATGYITSDVDGSGAVNSPDLIFLDANASAFVAKIRP